MLEYERQLAEEELKLQELNDQAKAVSADVDSKEQELIDLENEVNDAEDARRIREEDERKRELLAEEERNKIPKYVPIADDPVD